MIRLLITEMYGGKVDDEGDFGTLRGLVSKFMTPAAFEENYCITGDGSSANSFNEDVRGLALPSSTGWEQFISWVNALPEREPPSYLGLPPNAEKLLLVEQAKGLIQNFELVMSLLEENEQIMADSEP